MARSVQFNFSHVFEGVIWNMLALPGSETLILEVRDSEKKRTTFSALDCASGKFLWRNKSFDEPWWISLGAVSRDVILFTVYLETNNPDKKGVFAYHIHDEKILWWHNDFSIASVSGHTINGVSSKYGFKNVTLDIHTGKETSEAPPAQEMNDLVVRPHQYLSDSSHFSTVKIFLEQKFNLSPLVSLEYLECHSVVFVSFYVQENELANYLFMISEEGDLLVKEKLDEQLKGIGLGTFFILSSCVIFVKNKGELVSYRIV